MQKAINEFSTRKRSKGVFFAVVSLLCVFISTIYAVELKEGVRLGIKISASSIIPSIFPFFIFADFLRTGLYFKKDGIISRAFEKFFKINSSALGAFICGLVCGFPTGVKYAADLYEDGVISKNECERLICFVNNPSLAFCVSGVGAAMRGSIKDGIVLYVSVILSSVFVGLLISKKGTKSDKTSNITEQNFILSESIKNSGNSAITVSSYIIFFSCALKLAESFIKNEVFFSFLTALSEVGNSVFYISNECRFNQLFSFFITGFALGFSGFSVHMQAFVLLPQKINRSRYIIMKAVQGILCGVISLVICTIISSTKQ